MLAFPLQSIWVLGWWAFSPLHILFLCAIHVLQLQFHSIQLVDCNVQVFSNLTVFFDTYCSVANQLCQLMCVCVRRVGPPTACENNCVLYRVIVCLRQQQRRSWEMETYIDRYTQRKRGREENVCQAMRWKDILCCITLYIVYIYS